jgi:hypothetical protein
MFNRVTANYVTSFPLGKREVGEWAGPEQNQPLRPARDFRVSSILFLVRKRQFELSFAAVSS